MSLDDDLVKLFLKISEERRREYGDRIWNTVTYFTAVLSAILAVFGGLFVSKVNEIGEWWSILILFLASGIFVSIWAYFNVRREYERQMEAIAEIGKAQYYLGLTSEIPVEKRWFKQDKHIILERYFEDKDNFCRDKDWVRDKMNICKKKDKALAGFAVLFWGFACIYSIAIAIVLVFALS